MKGRRVEEREKGRDGKKRNGKSGSRQARDKIRGRKEQERKMDKMEYRVPMMSESTHRLLIMQKDKNCTKGVQTLL